MSPASFLDTSGDALRATRTKADGPPGRLPITPAMLLDEPSGHLFGMTQDAGMGWNPAEVARPQVLIAEHAGRAARRRRHADRAGLPHGPLGDRPAGPGGRGDAAPEGALPFAAYCSDPCDGRTQGTAGMFDSLPYRNDAAITMRRLIRSLPRRVGVMGIATCDKGLPATLLALAGCRDLPAIVVPGGVTLPAVGAEDAGMVQSIGARFAHGLITADYAADMGCRACGTPGGGCQFLGTAATSQIVAEALGLSLPHSALSPSGEPVWLDLAGRSARALLRLAASRIPLVGRADVARDRERDAAARGRRRLDEPAAAHSRHRARRGPARPDVEDWKRVNRSGAATRGRAPQRARQSSDGAGVHGRRRSRGDAAPQGHRPAQSGCADGDGGEALDGARLVAGERAAGGGAGTAAESDGVDPDRVIMSADAARGAGLTSTLVFPTGNLAPDGCGRQGHRDRPVGGRERRRRIGTGGVRGCSPSETDAIRAIKGLPGRPVEPDDVVVLIGGGPLGTGMEEIYQVTSALKYLPWGTTVSVVTDARFSGVSTGACIGHVGPEALAGGPIGRLRDGDVVDIVIDRANHCGRGESGGRPRRGRRGHGGEEARPGGGGTAACRTPPPS